MEGGRANNNNKRWEEGLPSLPPSFFQYKGAALPFPLGKKGEGREKGENLGSETEGAG